MDAATRSPIKSEQEKALSEIRVYKKQLESIEKDLKRTEKDLASLEILSPSKGIWVPDDPLRLIGRFIRRGEKIGQVVDLSSIIIRGVAGQVKDQVDIRIAGMPDSEFKGIIFHKEQSGGKELPSAALGYAGGGSIETDMTEKSGLKSAERTFQVFIKPVNENTSLLAGQRVKIRCATPQKPLVVQWWQSILRLMRKKFRI